MKSPAFGIVLSRFLSPSALLHFSSGAQHVLSRTGSPGRKARAASGPILRKPNTFFSEDEMNAGEALNRAHDLAFAPYAFEVARILRDRGLLAALEERGDEGLSAGQAATSASLPLNSATVLLEAGLGIGLVSGRDGRFRVTKAGHYFLQNSTVRSNTDLMRDLCLPGLEHLEASFEAGRPLGLSSFGDWSNIFEALPALPMRARQSWYAFNNHHSSAAFGDAMPSIFAQRPRRILDIGGSTGLFALTCLDYNDEVHIGIADLSSEPARTEPGIKAAIRAGRVTLHKLDVLDLAAQLPGGYDAIWMSQFMPCFSEDQIRSILRRCYEVLPDGGRLWLMEAFWDRQRYQAAAAAQQMTSVYFVHLATGVSRMWQSDTLLSLIAESGFGLLSIKDDMGRGHTLLELRKSSNTTS
jgi:hypothetical protein